MLLNKLVRMDLAVQCMPVFDMRSAVKPRLRLKRATMTTRLTKQRRKRMTKKKKRQRFSEPIFSPSAASRCLRTEDTMLDSSQ